MSYAEWQPVDTPPASALTTDKEAAIEAPTPNSPNKWGLAFILNAATTAGAAQDEKRRRRTCRVEGCTSYIIQMGRCCRHGVSWVTALCLTLANQLTLRVHVLSHQGTKRCLVDGCSTGAKHNGLCWKHGKWHLVFSANSARTFYPIGVCMQVVAWNARSTGALRRRKREACVGHMVVVPSAVTPAAQR